MYERFTDRARRVMQLANEEAQRFGHEYIGTEHVLLGLLKEGHGVAANVLKNLKIDATKVKKEIEKIVLKVQESDQVLMGRLPHTPRTKQVIERSVEEAQNLNHNYVGTEHLLLGLLRVEESVASQILMNLGLRVEEARAEVLNIVHKEPGSGATSPAEPDPEYIVAEVSKNWSGGRVPSDGKDHIAKQFEHVIGVNLGRGYVLHSWQLHRMTVPSTDPRVHIPVLNETIVAVFRRPAKPFFERAAVVVEEDGGRDAAAKAG